VLACACLLPLGVGQLMAGTQLTHQSTCLIS